MAMVANFSFTEYLRLLLLCVFQLPRSFATPALSVATPATLPHPLFSLFRSRNSTPTLSPLLHLLCLSLTPATLPHPLFRPLPLCLSPSRNLHTHSFAPLCTALSVAPFSAATAFSLPPRSVSLPLSYCKWSSKKPKTFDHEVESGRKGSGTVVEGGGRPHGMTKRPKVS